MWAHIAGLLWLLGPPLAALFLWLDTRRPGMALSFFYVSGLTSGLQLAALLALWLGPGLWLLWLGRRK